MKNRIQKSIGLMLILILVLGTVGCGKKPDLTVKNFFEAVQKQDFKTASTYVKNEDNKDNFKYDNADEEKMIKAIFSKLSYEIVSSNVNGKNATVKTKVTAPDLSKIYGKVMGDMMADLLKDAFSNEMTEDEVKQKFMKGFLDAVSDKDAPKTTTEVDIKLVKDKEWLIEPSDELLNAITGNLQKAVQEISGTKK